MLIVVLGWGEIVDSWGFLLYVYASNSEYVIGFEISKNRNFAWVAIRP